MATRRDSELADDKLREPCRKVLVSLNEHWSGLTLFADDPRIPLDNNYGKRLIRNPAVGPRIMAAERYERGSVLLTSNLLFSKREQIFKDPMTTAAGWRLTG